MLTLRGFSPGALLAFLLSAAAPLCLAAPLLVAVGDGGRRISSQDGLTWAHDQRWPQDLTAPGDSLLGVAFGLGKFIAVGARGPNGQILSTSDGQAWETLPISGGPVTTITFGSGRFVALDKSGLLFSTDGQRFERGETFPADSHIDPRRSAFGSGEAGSRFVIIGEAGITTERLGWRASSEDGLTFTSTTVGSAPARDIAYGSGHFVVVGPGGLIESSHDGQSWQRHPVAPGEDFSRVVWSGKRFLVTGGRHVWSSPDALTWNPEPGELPFLLWAQASKPALALAIPPHGGLSRTDDFLHWHVLPLAPGPPFRAMASSREDNDP